MWRYFFLWEGVDQTLAEPILDELWCFLPKESIPFLGDHTLLNENLKIILLIFYLFLTLCESSAEMLKYIYDHTLPEQFFVLSEFIVKESIFKFFLPNLMIFQEGKKNWNRI